MMGGLDSARLELLPSFSKNAFVAEISESFCEVSFRYLALSMLVLFSNNAFSSILLLFSLVTKLKLWDSINNEVTG